jgi:hypothetical protein
MGIDAENHETVRSSLERNENHETVLDGRMRATIATARIAS